MKEKVTLNTKEQKRLMVLNLVEAGKLTGREVAEVLGLSLRQVRRLLAAYREEGAAALTHGNRERKPYNALEESLKKRVVELAQSIYAGCNTQHFTELLAEREGIILSRSTVRCILLESSIRSPINPEASGQNTAVGGNVMPNPDSSGQIDGSRHDWLEGRGPRLSLIGAIDDATGKVPYALFRDQEDAQGYFLLLRQIVTSNGIPLALYHDRHGIFERSPEDKESLEEQLEGRRTPTQFGRLINELDITSISASSPQAKGRVERLWGTFQGRLVSELRMADAKTIQEANQVLWDFLPRYNSRFAVIPLQPGSAYRQPMAGFIPEEIFCFKYQRTVGSDNVVRFGEHRFQIEPGNNGRISYNHAKVEIHERLDGSIAVYYQGHCLITKSAPLEAPVLRIRNMARVIPDIAGPNESPVLDTVAKKTLLPKPPHHTKPAQGHPWRRPFKVHLDRG